MVLPGVRGSWRCCCRRGGGGVTPATGCLAARPAAALQPCRRVCWFLGLVVWQPSCLVLQVATTRLAAGRSGSPPLALLPGDACSSQYRGVAQRGAAGWAAGGELIVMPPLPALGSL